MGWHQRAVCLVILQIWVLQSDLPVIKLWNELKIILDLASALEISSTLCRPQSCYHAYILMVMCVSWQPVAWFEITEEATCVCRCRDFGVNFGSVVLPLPEIILEQDLDTEVDSMAAPGMEWSREYGRYRVSRANMKRFGSIWRMPSPQLLWA